MKTLTLSLLKAAFAICKLDASSHIPNWLSFINSEFISITKTEAELSIVCDQSIIPEQFQTLSIVKDWRGLKVEGPLDFSLTGILSALLKPLAEHKISIFAISTYDTDYVLVKEKDLSNAINVLRRQCIVHD